MGVESVDDYVWEHYQSWQGYDNFRSWLNSLSWHTLVWSHQIHDHAQLRAEEHAAKYFKLKLFRDSLDPPLRDRVDPFMDQQDKLRVAYRTISFCI